MSKIIYMDEEYAGSPTTTVKRARVYEGVVTVNSDETTVTFNLPSDFVSSLGVIIETSPRSSWTNSNITITHDNTLNSTGSVMFHAGSQQDYNIAIHLNYIASI